MAKSKHSWWTGEDAVRLSVVPGHVPPGPQGRVSLASVYRWTIGGLSDIRLRRFKIGGRWHTTVQEIDRFAAALTATAEGVA